MKQQARNLDRQLVYEQTLHHTVNKYFNLKAYTRVAQYVYLAPIVDIQKEKSYLQGDKDGDECE